MSEPIVLVFEITPGMSDLEVFGPYETAEAACAEVASLFPDAECVGTSHINLGDENGAGQSLMTVVPLQRLADHAADLRQAMGNHEGAKDPVG